MKLFKRILTLICVFVICFSSLSIPASAADTKQVGMTFWDWLTYLIEKGDSNASAYGGGAGRTADAYTAKVKQITDVLGTSTVGDNCIYLGNWSDDATGNKSLPLTYTFQSGSTFRYGCTTGEQVGQIDYIRLSSSFVVPVSGSYTITYYLSSTVSLRPQNFSVSWGSGSSFCPTVVSSDTKDPVYSETQSLSAGQTRTVTIGIPVYHPDKGTTFSVSGACRLEYPAGALATAAASGNIDITDNTRAGKFSGDYFYEGDNGKQIIADKVNLFNETNNTVTNPATGKTETAKTWYYDYSDRSYHYTTDSGNKGIVKYGDENASVTMQDSNGNTVTYNYYYYAKTGSGTDPGGTTDPGKTTTFKDLLIKFFSAVGDVLAGLVDGLLSLFTKVVDALGKLVDIFKQITQKILDLFGGFTDFLKGVFPFLPEEFFVILYLGALLVVAAAVFRKIWK